MHVAAGDKQERAAQRRLAMLSLLAPPFIAAGLVQTLSDTLGSGRIVALVGLVIAIGWLTGLLLGLGGKSRPAQLALLGLIAVADAAIVAGAGGLSSPFALLAIMPAVEAVWVRRDRLGLIAGAGASFAILLSQAQIQAFAGLTSGPVSAWHWIIPAIYLGTIVARILNFMSEREAEALSRRAITAEEVIEATVLRLSGTGDVLDVAGQPERLLGLQPALLLGPSFFERIHVGDRVAWLCALSDLRQGAASRKLELRLRSPRAADDAEVRYGSLAVEMASTGDPDVPAIAVLRSSDEVAALRSELETLRANADEIDIAKSRFLGVVSHELRTPLNAIIGFSDMLEHEMFGPFSDPRQKEYAGLIREAGNHLLAVVTSILDVSKIECGTYPIDPEPFQFTDAVRTCTSMIAAQASAKSLTLETEIAANAGKIVADRRAVQQMLINLLSNAVKFTPTGGSVTVGANRLGSRLHFWVGDTGIGIRQDDLGRLGRPFTQVRNDYTREYDGAGLGLSLVKGLVALHDGSMMIESAPGEGTLVTISLPVAGPAMRPADDEASVIPLSKDEVADGQARKIA